MKIAVALRTCASVFNYWDSTRFVDADKGTILLTCLQSLLKSIKRSKHDIVFSIHDDTSDVSILHAIELLCKEYGVPYELINSGRHNNFKSQYEWVKKQDYDYVYCVEDDYLHDDNAIDEMIEGIENANSLAPGIYAVFPFNCPHRYVDFNYMYPSYILRSKNNYWRSEIQSTHTFFVSKKVFDAFDDIMKFQAYNWPDTSAVENSTINRVWMEQNVRLIVPIRSLAYHLADSTQEEIVYDWKSIWKRNLYTI